MDWILVTERLPEDTRVVLVFLGAHPHPQPEVDRMASSAPGVWLFFPGQVTHWMPIPEAPK